MMTYISLGNGQLHLPVYLYSILIMITTIFLVYIECIYIYDDVAHTYLGKVHNLRVREATRGLFPNIIFHKLFQLGLPFRLFVPAVKKGAGHYNKSSHKKL